ncbi:hypothetical protein VN0835_02830 [Helicobacter pylori]
MFKANALKTKKYHEIAFQSIYWQQENFQKEGNISEKSEEKTYFECLNEISQNKLFKGLLGYGMFAERIPNFLTSKPFYKYCRNNKDKIFPKRKMGYQHITYEGIRDIGTPRYFAIPNPLAYYNQCKIR